MANIDILPSVPPERGEIEARGVEAALLRLYIWFADFLRNLISVLTDINAEIVELYAEKDFTPGLIAAGAQVTTTVTLTNIILGYRVTTSYDQDLALITMTSYVSAADTITVIMFNGTAGGITPAAGRLRCYVKARQLSV